MDKEKRENRISEGFDPSTFEENNDSNYAGKCENRNFYLIALTYYARLDYCLTDQRQTSDAPINSRTVTQDLRPHHFVQVFVNGYLLLSFLFLESLNDYHIYTVSLQQGTAKISLYTLASIKSMKMILWVFSKGLKRALRAIFILD